VPNWVEERTQMHFPQAEAGWLDAASKGRIGDDFKTDDEQKALNDTIAGECRYINKHEEMKRNVRGDIAEEE